MKKQKELTPVCLCGYADEKGNIVIPLTWEDADYFSEGLAGVQDSKGNWGFIDETGKLVIPCR